MKRVLLVPSDHGGGRGHVARCLYLAKTMRAAGLETALVLENKHFQQGINAGLPTYLLNTRRERFLRWQLKKPHRPRVEMMSPPQNPPVFLAFDGLAYQIPRDGYVSPGIVKYRFRQMEKIVNRFKPDVLIGDTHFLTFLLGRKYNLPVVQITRLAGYPPKPNFFWWLRKKPKFLKPDALAPFEPLLDQLAAQDVEKVEDLLRGDVYLVPASRDVEPIRDKEHKVVFSGPLAELSSTRQKIPFFDAQNEIPRIYVTIGGGAGRFSEQQFFEAILRIFDRTDFKVLVTTGRRLPAKLFQGKSANVVFTDWVDGLSAIQQSDLVIQHGGYGSTMEILLSGKPSIVIPFHSEQEGNGRRLKKLGVGDLLLPYEDETLYDLKFRWPYGEYAMKAAARLHLKPEMLFPMIDMIYDQQVYERLGKVQRKLQELQETFDPWNLLNMV